LLNDLFFGIADHQAALTLDQVPQFVLRFHIYVNAQVQQKTAPRSERGGIIL